MSFAMGDRGSCQLSLLFTSESCRHRGFSIAHGAWTDALMGWFGRGEQPFAWLFLTTRRGFPLQAVHVVLDFVAIHAEIDVGLVINRAGLRGEPSAVEAHAGDAKHGQEEH